MKTKLDLYEAVHAAAAETLDAKPKDAEVKITALLKPLNLDADDQRQFHQLFHSRRQRMLDLKDQALPAVEISAPAAAPVKTR
jgi:hypothetical protein